MCLFPKQCIAVLIFVKRVTAPLHGRMFFPQTTAILSHILRVDKFPLNILGYVGDTMIYANWVISGILWKKVFTRENKHYG